MTAGEVGVWMQAIKSGLDDYPEVLLRWWPLEEQDELERPMGTLMRAKETTVVRLDVRNAKVIQLSGDDLHLDDPEFFQKLAG